MRFEIGCSLEEVMRLHRQIFMVPFPLEQYQEKCASGKQLFCVGFYADDEPDMPIGFCVVIDHTEEHRLHEWIGGVIPCFQAQGVFSRFCDWLIRLGREKRYRSITVNTDNYKPNMIRLLIAKGFDIIDTVKTQYGDGTKIQFRYSLRDLIRLRLCITNACNLDCFFCHKEGADISRTVRISLPDLERILVQAWKCGVDDITITGGEPTAYFEAVEYVLKYCNSWNPRPTIKIITNGQLWVQEMVRQLAQYRGPLSVHISLSSTDENCLRLICGRSVSLDQYRKLAGWLNQWQIDFRFNAIILRGINSTPEAFRHMLRFAYANDIKTLHFMELLLTRKQERLKEAYCPFEEIRRNFLNAMTPEGIAVLRHESEKKCTYAVDYGGKALEISIYRLTCRCGCRRCVMENDLTIGADGKGYPCYLTPTVSCGDALSSLQETADAYRIYAGSVSPDFAFNQLYWG